MIIKEDDNRRLSVVVDIGGTNIRFARLTAGGEPGPVVKFATAKFPDLESAPGHFLDLEGGSRPDRLVVAVAGPVHGDTIKLTNLDWHFSIRRLTRDLRLSQLRVANDLEALAMLLPHLGPGDRVCVGGDCGPHSWQHPMAVLCPGTGLGIAGLVPADQRWRAIATEGGHTGLAPLTDREMAAWRFLRERYGRVSVERVLAGPGIVELYTALASPQGEISEALRPEEIVRLALDGADPLAVETMQMYCAWLGDVAGDVALMFMARGGVYLAGNILGSIIEILKDSRFRRRFEHKGRAAGVVAGIPTYLVTCDYPVLRGLAYLLEGS